MKLSVRTFLLFLVVFLLRAIPVFCQKIIFNKVAPPEGKTFRHITGITQDLKGYMWFATKAGLFSYDGYHLSSYQYDPINANSLRSNMLESVFADADGSIWTGSLGDGLDHLDPSTGIFTHYHHNPGNSASLANDTVTVILRDRQGILWIGTHGGLDQYNSKTNKFIHHRYNPADSTSISSNQVRAVYEDKHGTIWVGTGSPYPADKGRPGEGGLNRLNRGKGSFTRFQNDPLNDNSLVNNKVRAIYEDNAGILWIGTAKDGLHKMNRELGTFERIEYDPADPGMLYGPQTGPQSQPYDHITFIIQDVTGSYWIGSSDSGLNYFNPSIGKVMHFGEKGASDQYTDYGAWCSYISRDGILWIGTASGNIYRINTERYEIPHYTLAGGNVNCFYEEPGGNFWIGSDQDLKRIDKATGVTQQYFVSESSAGNNRSFVNSLKKDSKGNLWVGSSLGLSLWNKESNRFITYRHVPGNMKSLSNNAVFDIYEDKDANLWIGTAWGFNLLDRKTGTFTRYILYPGDTTLFDRNLVISILRDKSGRMWIGGGVNNGICLYDLNNRKSRNYLKGIGVTDIYEDSDGNLWVCTDIGLYRYDSMSDAFNHIGESNAGLGIPYAYSIVEDDWKYLWIGTSDGIARLNPRRDEISLYGKVFGIEKGMARYKSSYKGQHGELYFGDATGFYSFNPASLTRKVTKPEIILTAFRLADQLIQPGNRSLLKQDLSKVKEIELGHNQNVFSFDFTAIDYADPEENRQVFMLENYDKSWHPANSERRAYYFNVPPGKYVFRVKAVNGYGAWSEKKIDIIILSPWWRTTWAWCLYGILFLGLAFGIDRFQRRRIVLVERRKAREREFAQAKEIEKAYTELKATQAQLIQSEKMASLGELTAGIAHEIQNPLNFVNNFSDVNMDLLAEIKGEIEQGHMEEVNSIVDDLAENEEKINHHGKRAGAIVKGMLEHSRNSTGIKEPVDINIMAEEYLRLCYYGFQAKDKTFTAITKTDFDHTIGKIQVVQQDIGRVILNLLTNAFYAVREKKKEDLNGYQPEVSVSTRNLSDRIEIKVADNGNGIPVSVLDKIFQPFFTTKPAGEGTGLGLSLSYDIITKGHGGELKVQTKEGSGSEFIIVLST